jgi:hypothetical protein
MSIGLIQIGTSDDLTNMPSAGTIAGSAADMATGVWDGYSRDGNPSAPARASTAAYYYALVIVASNLIAMRVGNIGAVNGGKVARIIVSKARALMQTARPEIAAYEDFCAKEAGVYGADKASGSGQFSFGGYVARNPSASAPATGFAAIIAADGQSMGGSGWDLYGETGYDYMNKGQALLNRIPTVSDMRIPEIGRYYQGMAQSLLSTGKSMADTYELVVKAQKLQWAVNNLAI